MSKGLHGVVPSNVRADARYRDPAGA